MVQNADKGSLVTLRGDSRVTRVGRMIRKCRLDEISQLIDVLRGKMTLVGARPEVSKYTECYTPEMMATLLLPAGVTSLASIYFKDESVLLDNAEDTDKVYVEMILPDKMYYNLKAIEEFSFFGDLKIMLMTVLAVLGKKYKDTDRIPQSESEEVGA
jgi:lipopolysaccharide/colanic/teichoic acid biosynthesis glycosyltransferase